MTKRGILTAVLMLLLLLGGCRTGNIAGQEGNMLSRFTEMIPPRPNGQPAPLQSQPFDGDTAVTGKTVLSPEEATQAALAHAGLTTDQVTHLRIQADLDERIPHYDVEFYQGGYEYGYEIHAETGKVLEHEKELG